MEGTCVGKDPFKVDVLGGSDGASLSAEDSVVTLGDDFVPVRGSLCLSVICFGRLGGRGGWLEGLKAGGIIRPPSMDGVLEVDILTAPFDKFEIFEVIEFIDSLDSRRPSVPDGLLGGRDGDTCEVTVLGGSLGGVCRIGFETV